MYSRVLTNKCLSLPQRSLNVQATFLWEGLTSCPCLFIQCRKRWQIHRGLLPGVWQCQTLPVEKELPALGRETRSLDAILKTGVFVCVLMCVWWWWRGVLFVFVHACMNLCVCVCVCDVHKRSGRQKKSNKKTSKTFYVTMYLCVITVCSSYFACDLCRKEHKKRNVLHTQLLNTHVTVKTPCVVNG